MEDIREQRPINLYRCVGCINLPAWYVPGAEMTKEQLDAIRARAEKTSEQTAQSFHNLYEKAAPAFGYKTREETSKPWIDVPENNRMLMTTVCGALVGRLKFDILDLLTEVERLQMSNKQLEAIIESKDLPAWYVPGLK